MIHLENRLQELCNEVIDQPIRLVKFMVMHQRTLPESNTAP